MMLPSDPVSIELGAQLHDVTTQCREWTSAYYRVVDLIWAQCENLGLRNQRLEMTLSGVDGWSVTSPLEDDAT